MQRSVNLQQVSIPPELWSTVATEADAVALIAVSRDKQQGVIRCAETVSGYEVSDAESACNLRALMQANWKPLVVIDLPDEAP